MSPYQLLWTWIGIVAWFVYKIQYSWKSGVKRGPFVTYRAYNFDPKAKKFDVPNRNLTNVWHCKCTNMCQCVKVYLNCKILLSARLTLKIGWIFRHWQNMFLKYAKGVQPNQFIKLWIAKTIKFDIRSYFLIFMRVIFPCRSKIY